jgi:hypothetical protein
MDRVEGAPRARLNGRGARARARRGRNAWRVRARRAGHVAAASGGREGRAFRRRSAGGAGRGGAARVGGRPRAPGERMDDAPPRVFRPVGFLALRHQQQWMDGRKSVAFSTLVVANDGHGADMLY